MTFNPTPRQALLLFGLLARHGEAAQADLMPAVVKADREALLRAKLIAVDKRGRGLRLTLDDAGWAWSTAHLNAELPPAQRTLSDILKRLDAHLKRRQETLADFIGSKPDERAQPNTAKPKSTKSKLAEPKPPKPKPPKPPSAAVLRKRIETAYLSVTGGRKDEGVPLARLRMELADLDRAIVDVGLGRILKGDKKASLLRHDDPRQIDRADEDAAFNPSGEPFHVIWIAS